MTEEIKEILEYLKDDKKISFGSFGTEYKRVELNDVKLLLNYITNLQKENTDLKKLCDKYEEEHNTAFKLWKANMEKIPPFDKFLDYKQRNEKAIEYIENNLTISSILDGKTSYCLNDYSFDYEVLLNILQGGDEE